MELTRKMTDEDKQKINLPKSSPSTDVRNVPSNEKSSSVLGKLNEPDVEADPTIYTDDSTVTGLPTRRNPKGKGLSKSALKKARNSDFNISKVKGKAGQWLDKQRGEHNPVEYIGAEKEPEPPYNPLDDLSGDEKKLYGDVHNTQPDITETVSKQGQKNKEKAEEIMPHHSTKTWKDVFEDPEYEGKRGSYLLDTLGGALRSAGTGNVEDTAMNRQNRILEENYAKNIADRDTRATNMALEGLEAVNAQQSALETNLADTMANTYIQRYKSAQDAETKKQVLEQMAEDSDELFSSVFSGPDGEEKLFNLASLMGLYAGDFSLSQRLIQKYAPQLIEKFDNWLNDKGFGSDGNGDEPKKKATGEQITSPGGTYTIDPQDVEDNPDNYIEIPLGGGQTMLVRRWGISQGREEIEAVEDALMNNPNLSDEERYELANEWAGKIRSNLTKSEMTSKMRERDKEQEAKDKLEKDQQAKEEKFLTAVQDILKSNDTPEVKVKKLGKLDTNGITNPVALNLFNKTLTDNQRIVASSMQSAIETDKKLSNGQKAKQLRDLTTQYRDFLTPETLNEIEDKITRYDYLYEHIDPYEEQADRFVEQQTFSGQDNSGGASWKTVSVDENGDPVFISKSNKNALGKDSVLNPSTADFSKLGNVNPYLQVMLDMTEPNTLARMFPNATVDEIQSYFKDTKEYKLMAKLLNNSTLKDRANATKTWGLNKGDYKDENLKLLYDSLEQRFNKIMNGKLFE